MLIRAWAIVKEAFKDKVDLSGKPYFDHLVRVMHNLPIRFDDDETLQTMALLHDLLEDCPEWNVGKLSEYFSTDVVQTVVDLTHKKYEPYASYIVRVSKNPNAIAVKLADLKDNMDITRLEKIEERDVLRLKKYHAAYMLLKFCENNISTGFELGESDLNHQNSILNLAV